MTIGLLITNSLSIAVSGGVSTSQGHAIIQSDCGSAGVNGVVDFNYSP
jgi:hypothetical protein